MANVDLLSHIVSALQAVQAINDASKVVKLGKAKLQTIMADPRTASCRVSGGDPLAAVIAPYTPGFSRGAIGKEVSRLLADAEHLLADARKTETPKPVAA